MRWKHPHPSPPLVILMQGMDDLKKQGWLLYHPTNGGQWVVFAKPLRIHRFAATRMEVHGPLGAHALTMDYMSLPSARERWETLVAMGYTVGGVTEAAAEATEGMGDQR